MFQPCPLPLVFSLWPRQCDIHSSCAADPRRWSPTSNSVGVTFAIVVKKRPGSERTPGKNRKIPAFSGNCSTGLQTMREWRAYSTAIVLLDTCRPGSPDITYNKPLISMVSADQQLQKWTQVAVGRGTQKTAAIGNNRNLYQLIKKTGPCKPTVSKGTNESDNSLICS